MGVADYDRAGGVAGALGERGRGAEAWMSERGTAHDPKRTRLPVDVSAGHRKISVASG